MPCCHHRTNQSTYIFVTELSCDWIFVRGFLLPWVKGTILEKRKVTSSKDIFVAAVAKHACVVLAGYQRLHQYSVEGK